MRTSDALMDTDGCADGWVARGAVQPARRLRASVPDLAGWNTLLAAGRYGRLRDNLYTCALCLNCFLLPEILLLRVKGIGASGASVFGQ